VDVVIAHLFNEGLVGRLVDLPPVRCERTDLFSGRVRFGVVAIAKHLKGVGIVSGQKRLEKKDTGWSLKSAETYPILIFSALANRREIGGIAGSCSAKRR
jgi:hypothetical protein